MMTHHIRGLTLGAIVRESGRPEYAAKVRFADIRDHWMPRFRGA